MVHIITIEGERGLSDHSTEESREIHHFLALRNVANIKSNSGGRK